MNENGNKQKLIFSCKWERNKRVSWSGTHFSIYKQLAKYFDVINFDYGIRKPYSFVNAINRKIFGLSTNGCNLEEHYINKMREKFSKGSYNSFQFSQCPNQDNIHSYIYIDLCFGVLKELALSNPTIFNISGFSGLKIEEITNLEKKQSVFLKQHVKKIFTMGIWLKKWLIAHYSIPDEKVIAVGAGFNLDSSLIDYTRKAGNKILFVGKDFKRKNGPLVIEAFKLAKKYRPDIELFIVGGQEGSYEDGLEGIHFEGLLDFKKEASFFNLCDIFCMPSLFEAYGIVFPEALTFGLPVIGNNSFEMPYFIQDEKNGYLLKHNDSNELSKLMLNSLANKVMQENVKKDKEKYINKYSWETIGKYIANEIQKFT